MTDRSFANKAAIVGIGSTDYAALHRSAGPVPALVELALKAAGAAVADAGLAKDDIDGLVVSGLPSYEPFMFRSGLHNVRFLAHYPLGGRLCPAALGHAAMAVVHKMANYVVLFNAVGFRSQGIRFGEEERAPRVGDRPVAAMESSYALAYGMSSPGAMYALAHSKYRARYGATDEELSQVAIAFRRWASLNPSAIFQEPLSTADYLEARYIAEPLRLFDYCLVNDGCAAYVVTTAERAQDLAQPPVLIAAVAERANVREYYADEDLWQDACRSLSADLFEGSGLGPADIDSVQIYDNFSPAVLWVLEGFGFAPQGDALRWMAGGTMEPGGTLPVNTSGGMLSEAYLQGWNGHVEAVRQLRGQAGERQIGGCRTVLYAGLSAVPGADILVRGD